MTDSLNGKRFRIGSIAYFICAAIFAVCIFVQIFIAGWAIFVSPIAWTKHFMFVHVFGFNIPVFMLVSALIGKLPRFAFWHVFWSMLFIFVMYFTANMKNDAIPWAGALHPAAAVILWMIAWNAVLKSWNLIKGQE